MWRGALIAFLADNLAAHEIGGFKESFSFAGSFAVPAWQLPLYQEHILMKVVFN